MTAAPFQGRTKAETLHSLRGRLKAAEVLPLHYFSVGDWHKDRNAVLNAIRSQPWGSGKSIVRSSCRLEDGTTESNAGRFLSILRVEQAEVASAIDRVIASYGRIDPLDQVLIQPMLEDASMTGVAFSRDPATRAPYRVINYSESADTTAITSGSSGHACYVSQGSESRAPAKIAGVLALICELESVFPSWALDIEFAVRNGLVYLLQIRPLSVAESSVHPKKHLELLQNIAERIVSHNHTHPFLHGDRTAFGVMPDWNPAEMIGIRPKPLALSLYRELITDSIWAYQRHNYGYKNLRSFPLMVHFHGLPYIDVRVSFNSFIPRDIEGSLADRLVNYYIDRLLDRPSLHDKVEFEIVLSCYTLDLDDRLKHLREACFTESDVETLRQSLRKLTNGIIHFKSGLWRQDRDRLPLLASRRDKILASGLDPVSRVYWLLEDCKRYGTLPFAGLARAGFIAVQMLRSLVACGVLSEQEYGEFMGGLETVGSQLTRDLGSMERGAFLAKYGHLRPGTYDIQSPRYDEAPDVYFDWSSKSAPKPEPREPFRLSLTQMRETGRLLKAHGLEYDVVELFDFLQAGIELREYSKFLFTRSLSDALSAIHQFGRELGYTAEDLSHADIGVFYELHAAAADPRRLLSESIARGRERYAETCSITLPPVIVDASDVWAFHLAPTEPNFVTQKSVTAPVGDTGRTDTLKGAVVAIPSADPGFDWVFSHGIAGLVTAYGGVNSHMAIRANELGIPSVIGAGEENFRRWSAARILHIDCAVRRVDVLS